MAFRKSRRAWLIAILLLASTAGTLWFVGRTPVLLWLAEYTVANSDGRLELQGVEGSLYGPIRIATLVFETAERRIELSGFEFDWSPRDIVLDKKIHVQTLRIQKLRLTIKQPGTEPLQLPNTLQFPLGLEIPAAMAEHIVIETADQRHEFSRLKLSLNNPEGEYQVRVTLDTPWGRGDAIIGMGAVLPYRLGGRVQLDHAGQPHPYKVDVTLAGSLGAIKLAGTGSVGAAQATVSATLAPFDAVPLKQAALNAQHINPQQFGADLPQADVAVDVTLQAKSPDIFQGVVGVVNATHGTLDGARIPFKQLQAVFEGTFDKLAFGELQLDLAEAGRFSGAGGLQQGKLSFDLTTTGLNLRGIHSTLKPTQLAGKVQVAVEGTTHIVRADLGQEQYRIQLDALHRDAVVEIKSARISSADSELALQGALKLAQAREFQAEGTLIKFDPARFGDYPAASINARFTATGQLQPVLQSTLQVTIADSQYRNRPLSGKGGATVAMQRLWDADVALQLGADRFAVNGAFGEPGDVLNWRLNAADVGAWVGPRFGGRIAATGTLAGTLQQTAGTFDINAGNLDWDGAHHVAQFAASGQLEQGLDGPLALKAELHGYRSAGLEIEQVLINATGRRTAHEIGFSARNKIMDMRATFNGAWGEGSAWTGTVASLENHGRYPAMLKAPATLTLERRKFTLTGASVTFAGGEIRIGELMHSDGRMSSHGVLAGLRGAEFLRMTQQPLHAQTTLIFGGKWALSASDKLNGEIVLWRDQGDVTMLTEPHTALGLTRLALQTAVVDNQLTTELDLAGTTLGSITARIQSSLAQKDGVWGIVGDAALILDADANMPSIAWITPLLGKQMGIDGAVKVRMSAQGTVSRPNLSGELKIDGLKFDYPEYGISFRQGNLQASMDSSNQLAGHFDVQGGAGSVSGKGGVSWESGEPEVEVALVAKQLELLSRPDRLLIVSGNGDARLHAGKLGLSAKLRIDRGLIDLPEEDAPSLSEDVVVLGQPDAVENRKAPYAIIADIDLDLGDRFYLKGKGVDAQLVGAVKVHASGKTAPTASGKIQVAKGRYSAYGQSLSIERGILNFIGPIDNPGLNIVALRKNLPVEAGVAISGTAQVPQVRLTSIPSVPDSEKLSWLVLGHGLEKTSGGEFGALQAAAGALLAQGESVSLEAKIAHAAGLDEFSLSGAGGVENAVLTMGKRLSSRAYLTFEQGLAGASNLAKINYTLTERLSVRTQTGEESAVDLFYSFSFD